MHRQLATAFALLTILFTTSRRVAAQTIGWSGAAEAAASVFQGNTDQRAVFAKSELGKADSSVQVRGMVSFGYADSAPDTLRRAVTKRTWLGNLAVDYRPYASVSPFAFLNYEASYEKRMLDRIGIGVGGKVALVSLPTREINVSLALLAERLRPTRLSPLDETTSTARWSWRGRVRQTIDERVKISHTTFYQPRVSAWDAYMVNSTSELSYALRESTSLTLSYLVQYDSEARSRGALSNNDAQLLFGVKTTF